MPVTAVKIDQIWGTQRLCIFFPHRLSNVQNGLKISLYQRIHSSYLHLFKIRNVDLFLKLWKGAIGEEKRDEKLAMVKPFAFKTNATKATTNS